MIQYYDEMKVYLKQESFPLHSYFCITAPWLCDFTEGDGFLRFYTNKYKPRLKYEKHIKEYNLFLKINDFFQNTGNFYIYTCQRNNITFSCIVLEFNQVSFLINFILPFFENNIFYTKKNKDFKD